MKKFKRITALVLSLLILGSGTFAVAAEALSLQNYTCQLCGQTGTHTEDCELGKIAGYVQDKIEAYKESQSEESTGATEESTGESTEESTGASEPSEESSEPAEGATELTETTATGESDKTFAENLLEIDNLSDLLIEICKADNMAAVLALTTEEITALEFKVETLYAAIENPTVQETRDWNDLLDTLAVLPNSLDKNLAYVSKGHTPDWGALYSADDVDDLLNISKDVTTGTESDYKLTLDAYTTMEISGNITDLVLVLDQSGSMFHAADVGNTEQTFTSDNGKGYRTYINNSMTFSEMEAEAKASIANGNSGASMTGYYMARVDNKLYALRRGSDGTWYRTGANYPGTAGTDNSAAELTNAKEGQVATYSEYADIKWETSGKNKGQCYKSIYGVTYDALQAFLNAIKGTPNLRVAVVGFAGGSNQNWEGTGVYLDGTWLQFGEGFTYSTIGSSDYFKETWDSEEMESLQASINAFWPRRNATATEAGFNIASELFERDGGDEDESKKNHIILLFSDGQPTTGNPTAVASNLKNGLNKNGTESTGYITEIYTVGPDCLHSDIAALEEWATDENHYAAPTIENMNATFEKIASSIIATTLALDETAYLYDGIAPSFQLPAGLLEEYNMATTDAEKEAILKERIKVYTADAVFTGDELTFSNMTLFDDADIILTEDKTGIKVSNFDYSSNYVTKYPYEHPETGAENFYGRKLIVEIPIDIKPDFLGGDNIFTNSIMSGIYYASGEALKYYTSPEVDVAVKKIEPKYTINDIYVSQQASLPDVIMLGEYSQNGTDWKVDGINNGYVDIVYTITDPNGASITYTIPAGTAYSGLTQQNWSEGAQTHPLLKEDTKYTVTCKVTSTNNSENTQTGTAYPEVKVYKPVITFQDSAINLGQKADYDAENHPAKDHLIWKHGETIADTAVMGIAPELDYTYDPEAKAFDTDTNVKVTVTAKSNGTNIPEDQDITQYVTFYRAACEYKECNHKNMTQVISKDSNRVNFVVHIKTFDLTITKAGIKEQDGNAPFVFNVYCGETGINMDVVIYGNNSVTIKGLPSGTYTVTETSGYWRYDVESAQPGKSQHVTPSGGTAKVTFTNTRTEDKWLDDWAKATNTFGEGASYDSGAQD